MSLLSSSLIGVTSAAVPVKNASSAVYTSSRVILFSITSTFRILKEFVSWEILDKKEWKTSKVYFCQNSEHVDFLKDLFSEQFDGLQEFVNIIGNFEGVNNIVLHGAKKKGKASVLLIGPIYNMATGFSYIYPFKKEIMFNTAKIYNEINKTIGGYTENSLIYIHKKSSIFSPGLSFYEPSPLMDLSHLNARLYQNQFIQTDISKKYINKSVQEFQYAPELIDNIKSMIVLSIIIKAILEYLLIQLIL